MDGRAIAIPTGVTAVLSTTDNTPAATGPTRGFRLAMHHRDAQSLELALAIDDREPARVVSVVGSDTSGDEDSPAAPAPRRFVTEIAVIEPFAVGGPISLAIVVPFAFDPDPTRAVLLLIDAMPGGGASAEDELALRQALERCTEDLQRTARETAARPTVIAAAIAEWPGYEAALASLTRAESRRAGLAYASGETGADICEDVALVADDSTLQSLAERVVARTSAAATQPAATQPAAKEGARAALGWLLDVASLDLMSSLQSSNKLPPELVTVLVRHAGEAGRGAGAVEEALKGARSRAEFDARVQAENFVALEDNSPAVRVRAYDWLNARGRAPAGYDPLGPPRQRHVALEKVWEAMAASTGTPTTRPGNPGGDR
jgi:hypothetical protein